MRNRESPDRAGAHVAARSFPFLWRRPAAARGIPAVYDMAVHIDMSLRDAAYLIAVDRVVKACRARGSV
jgi:hypothetical protein